MRYGVDEDGRRLLTAHQVALHGLSRRRKPETLYGWITKYQSQGIPGLIHKPRGHRGFPPQQARMLINTIHRSPESFGLNSPRWRLSDLRVLPWLSDYSLPGIWMALKRLGVLRKRGKLSVHLQTHITRPSSLRSSRRSWQPEGILSECVWCMPTSSVCTVSPPWLNCMPSKATIPGRIYLFGPTLASG